MSSPEQQRTDWFPGDVLPARPGVYERAYTLCVGGGRPTHNWEIGYARFDGKKWFFRADTADKAEAMNLRSGVTHRFWRGLAQKPKGGVR